ncbi:1346_t:CDS:1, partial [Ambispora leptoticha]
MQAPTGFTMPLSTQGLRWIGFFRSENKRGGNRYTAKCKYCLTELNGKPEKLHQHVLRCNDWPILEKTNYLHKVGEESSSSRKRTHDEDTSVNPTIQDDENVSESSMSHPHQETIVKWFAPSLSQSQSEKLHQKLLKAMIYGN